MFICYILYYNYKININSIVKKGNIDHEESDYPKISPLWFQLGGIMEIVILYRYIWYYTKTVGISICA